MKLDNQTLYASTDLKKRMTAIMKDMGVSPKGYCIEIVYARGRRREAGMSGLASYTRKWIRLKLTRPKLALNVFDAVFKHEVMHTLGVRHERGEGCLMHRFWTPDLLLNSDYIHEQPVVACSPIDKHAAKLANAQKNLKKATTRLKRAQTIHKKWERRVNLYKRKVKQ